jgi:hypothetical protein
MPSSKGSGNSGDELEWPLLLREETRIDVCVLLPPHGLCGADGGGSIRCQTLHPQMPALVTQARDGMRNMDFDIRQPTIAHVQTDVGAMAQYQLILFRGSTCDGRGQDSGDSVTDVVVP